MDGLILIRSVTLSNHIAGAPQPEGVVGVVTGRLGGCGRDNAVRIEGTRGL
jgi:hypothetical protein